MNPQVYICGLYMSVKRTAAYSSGLLVHLAPFCSTLVTSSTVHSRHDSTHGCYAESTQRSTLKVCVPVAYRGGSLNQDDVICGATVPGHVAVRVSPW